MTISLIPHTYSETILGTKKIGDQVNIETDLLGKYVLHHLNKNKKSSKSSLTLDFLHQNGF